ncbi:MAG: cytochrome c oxidase assembly protein [Alphaproteobacteria bacterium]
MKPNNRNIAIGLVVMVVGLLLGSFASAPLYRLFCQITGFGGTPQNASANPSGYNNSELITVDNIKGFQPLAIFFDKTIATNTPIRVTILTPKAVVKINQPQRIIYQVENLTDQPLIITSTYNATPHKYASNIVKTECFCFYKQPLQPRAKKDMSLVFFISPRVLTAEGANKLRELTVGYHFFLAQQ